MIGRALRAFERFVDATGRIAAHVKSIDDHLGAISDVLAAEAFQSSSYSRMDGVTQDGPVFEADRFRESVVRRVLASNGWRVPE